MHGGPVIGRWLFLSWEVSDVSATISEGGLESAVLSSLKICKQFEGGLEYLLVTKDSECTLRKYIVYYHRSSKGEI